MISISIIIPVYNVELYVRKCIQSIIEQDILESSIECIIVDDCSPDNSMSIIHSVVNNYRGQISFLFLKHEQNKGLSAARNTGIDAAHSDYILFVDPDDWLPAGSISKFVKVLLKYPNLDMVIGNRFSTREKCIFQNRINIETIFDNYQIRKLLLNYQVITCSAWNKIIKTDIIKRNKFYEGIIFEDIPWAYILFKEIKHTLVFPEVTYIYENDHPYSISNTAKNKENISLHMKSVNYIGNTILDAPYNDLFADTIISFGDLFIVAYRLQYEYELNNEDCKQLRQLRDRLVYTCFKKGRFFLALFVFTLTYPPTSFIFQIGWFRRHYCPIAKTARIIANFFEKLHRKPQHTPSDTSVL